MSVKNAPPPPGHACQVLSGDAIYVINGVNNGDGLTGPEEVCPGDIYALDESQQPLRLVVTRAEGLQRVGMGSEIGQPGDALRFEARYTMMSSDGDQVDLVLISLPDGTRIVLPLSPMAAQNDYTLLKIGDAPQDTGLADLLCVSFARGTMITLASGQQRAIESLKIGDKVLSRDHGGQAIRWIGSTTLRAVGAFAPVVITAGTLGNSGDLLVSQHHRMFLYQRKRSPGLATSELLVQAKHLVDHKSVFIQEGGFVDFFSIVFDHHEIIYAEGVPAESLMVNDATVNRLPTELSEDVKARFPGLSQNQHFGTEAGRQFLDSIGPEALFKSPRTAPARQR
ncbi:MAG: Hint domain-containing protein [Cypionkella sp.]|uniref:Hint domain-containing protein n=1 Tax=Cypionkella sp. TaxID=2811411 RepID=UPI002AB86A20|nr:Hint domain-containing protein [Cypionkella sp.]MDZ4309246.1 Hint domain-containing protein [Cypionkella sp.]